MTASEYKELRKRLGSQEEVARLLQVNDNTVSRREKGQQPVSEEAALAILHLVEMRAAPPAPKPERVPQNVETPPLPVQRPQRITKDGRPTLWKAGWK